MVKVVLPRGLAEFLRVAERIAQVVGHLERLADARAQFLPWLGILTGRHRAHLRRRDEQGPGLRAMIG